jgi:hypothetical protein
MPKAKAPTTPPAPVRGETPRVRLPMIPEDSYIFRPNRTGIKTPQEDRILKALTLGTEPDRLVAIVKLNVCHPAKVLKLAGIEIDEKSETYQAMLAAYLERRGASI